MTVLHCSSWTVFTMQDALGALLCWKTKFL